VKVAESFLILSIILLNEFYFTFKVSLELRQISLTSADLDPQSLFRS
jgi:hypothetical protein